MNEEVQSYPGPDPRQHKGGRGLPGDNGPPRNAEAQIGKATGPRQSRVPRGEPHSLRALPWDIPPRWEDGRGHRAVSGGLRRRPHGRDVTRRLPPSILSRSRAGDGGCHRAGPHGAGEGAHHGRRTESPPWQRGHPWRVANHGRSDGIHWDIGGGGVRNNCLPGIHGEGDPGQVLEQARILPVQRLRPPDHPRPSRRRPDRLPYERCPPHRRVPRQNRLGEADQDHDGHE